jgi:hypothetical protein
MPRIAISGTVFAEFDRPKTIVTESGKIEYGFIKTIRKRIWKGVEKSLRQKRI